MAKKCIPMVKRMFSAIWLWIIFWFLCASIASIWAEEWFWWSLFMWNLFYNRVLIWLVIAFSWFVTFHPLLKIRMYPALRWALLWAIVSLWLSFTIISLWLTTTWIAISWTLVTWLIIGMVIDLIATKLWWEWKDLNKKTQKK